MRIHGWTRVVVLVSMAWVMGVCGVVLYELFHWAPTASTPNGDQWFFYYYSDPSVTSGFIPLLKGFDTAAFLEALLWPLAALWASYFLLSRGVRWVRNGFKDTSP